MSIASIGRHSMKSPFPAPLFLHPWEFLVAFSLRFMDETGFILFIQD